MPDTGIEETEGPVAESTQVRARRVHGRLGRVRRRARAGLVQALGAAAGIALGLTLPLIHLAPMIPTSKVGSELATVGFGLLSVISVIFSLLYLVAQWAFANFTPRLSSFVDDPIIWRTFAFAVAVFVYFRSAANHPVGRVQFWALVPLQSKICS
jgi:uncharacterized membrane protein